MTIQVADLDFQSESQIEQFLNVLTTYSQEAGAGNQGMSEQAKADLPRLLNELPNRQVLVAIIDELIVGVAVCLSGFSTFKAKPVLNVHDLAVLPSHRGQGIGSTLLAAAEDRARELGCCKMTLEVISTNEAAHRLYSREGFDSPSPNLPTFFLEKPLS